MKSFSFLKRFVLSLIGFGLLWIAIGAVHGQDLGDSDLKDILFETIRQSEKKSGDVVETERFGIHKIREPKIGPRDKIQIDIFLEPDLSAEITVSADGEIRFPLLKHQPINVSGKTRKQVENELEKLLKPDYLINPQITVTIIEFYQIKVTVSGEVKLPAIYPFDTDKPTTVTEAIAMAGWFTKLASKSNIRLRRDKQVFRFKHKDLTKPEHKYYQFLVQDGDIIEVGESWY
ncbi:MAG TPA: polysaccharide export protein [Verrucomicrobiales bacterium]|nr:polysaccharide export protein [Verrucomicrobiales bacterium]HIL70907.1 polysaccharide export protein [Verrucomicrobiota bacterium]